VFANIFNMGAVAPPSTPGQTPPPIVLSSVPTIPQLPWPPVPTNPPPVNTALPVVTAATDLQVGSVANATTGTWTNATSYAYQWLRDGAPIFPGSGASYTFAEADAGLMIAVIVTAIGPGGEASAESNEIGPVLDAAAEPVVVRSGGGRIPPRSGTRKRAR
jgi:hypothetical protein